MNISNKRILVTGSAGFIGSYLSESLLKKNNSILGLDSLNDYYSVELKAHRIDNLQKYKKFTFHKISLTEMNKLKSVIEEFDPEIVINLAAQAGVRYSEINPGSYLDSNLVSFFNLLESIKNSKIEKFIFASSSSVYGLNSEIPFKEVSQCSQPSSLYAATKQANESMAYAFAVNSRIPTIGLRFFTVYGPMGRPDMAYYNFSKLIKEKQSITIFNEGKMSRDMTYIDDIVTGIESSILFEDFTSDVKFEIFNLGNNKPVSTWDLINHIQTFMGHDATYQFQASSLEVKETWADLKKSRDLINYQPKVNFNEGMNRFLEWFIDFHY